MLCAFALASERVDLAVRCLKAIHRSKTRNIHRRRRPQLDVLGETHWSCISCCADRFGLPAWYVASGSEPIGSLTSSVVGIDLGERNNVVELALGGVFPAVSGGGHIDRVLGWLMRKSGETDSDGW